jgi:uncharacterized protein (TIGR02391 family)
MAKKKALKKRRSRTPPVAATKAPPIMKITATRRRLIGTLADLLAEIAPATSRGKSSFCVRNIAVGKGHKKLWKELSNKRKTIAAYLENVFRRYPRMPKRLVLEIVTGGVKWSARRGKAVTPEHVTSISAVLVQLGVNAKKELNKVKLPDPSRVVLPPLDLQSQIDRLELHEDLKDDCLRMFKSGHLNEAVRKALERFEKMIQDETGDHGIGKDLMGKAFNRNSPLIAINDGTSGNDGSEQEGFMHLTMGAMAGMRNLYSHGDVKTMTPMDAFERLCFVSLLFKRIDKALQKP